MGAEAPVSRACGGHTRGGGRVAEHNLRIQQGAFADGDTPSQQTLVLAPPLAAGPCTLQWQHLEVAAGLPSNDAHLPGIQQADSNLVLR